MYEIRYKMAQRDLNNQIERENNLTILKFYLTFLYVEAVGQLRDKLIKYWIKISHKRIGHYKFLHEGTDTFEEKDQYTFTFHNRYIHDFT